MAGVGAASVTASAATSTAVGGISIASWMKSVLLEGSAWSGSWREFVEFTATLGPASFDSRPVGANQRLFDQTDGRFAPAFSCMWPVLCGFTAGSD